MRNLKTVIQAVIGTVAAISLMGAEPGLAPIGPTPGQAVTSTPPPVAIFQGEVGGGFRSSIQTFSLEAAAAGGIVVLGSRQAHDFGLLSLSYGHMLHSLAGKDHWYRGNWEIRGELFGGGQFSPSSDWLIGLTPHLRYNFATGTRWVPFADGGVGVTATGIGAPDLSNTFEFNSQVNIGVHLFVRDNAALTFEVGYMHVSCAGISEPNLGVNYVKGAVGITCFF